MSLHGAACYDSGVSGGQRDSSSRISVSTLPATFANREPPGSMAYGPVQMRCSDQLASRGDSSLLSAARAAQPLSSGETGLPSRLYEAVRVRTILTALRVDLKES